MPSRTGVAASPAEAEDPACTRAWDRLEEAAARLQRVGGAQIEPALEAFYDAWTERLATVVSGAEDAATMRRLQAAMRLLEAAAAKPDAYAAMEAFVEIALLEVEPAVVQSVGDPAAAALEAAADQRCGNC